MITHVQHQQSEDDCTSDCAVLLMKTCFAVAHLFTSFLFSPFPGNDHYGHNNWYFQTGSLWNDLDNAHHDHKSCSAHQQQKPEEPATTRL
jgi:hypothetical protein